MIVFLLADGTCEGFKCDDNADCNRTFPSGRRRCLCKPGWQGNGQSCSGNSGLLMLISLCGYDNVVYTLNVSSSIVFLCLALTRAAHRLLFAILSFVVNYLLLLLASSNLSKNILAFNKLPTILIVLTSVPHRNDVRSRRRLVSLQIFSL